MMDHNCDHSDRDREPSEESERVGWKCSVPSSTGRNSELPSSSKQSESSGQAYLSSKLLHSGQSMGGCVDEDNYDHQETQRTVHPSSPPSLPLSLPPSSPSSSSLPKLLPSIQWSAPTITVPHASLSSSSLLHDPRPPKPKMDLLPGHYWVFRENTNHWVQMPRWKPKPIPAQPLDTCTPCRTSPETKGGLGKTDKRTQQKTKNSNAAAARNRKRTVAEEKNYPLHASVGAPEILHVKDSDGKLILENQHQGKRRRCNNPDTDTGDNANHRKINIDIPSDLGDLRQTFSDDTIALLLAVLIQLARQGNNNAGHAISALNRVLDDEVPCLPTRSDLEKFCLQEHTLTDLIRTVTSEAEIDRVCNTNHKDTSLSTALSGLVPPPPDQPPTSPEIIPVRNPLLEATESIQAYSDNHPGSLSTFIIAGAKRLTKKSARTWLIQANQRLTAVGIGAKIQLESVRVDGKRSAERFITVSSTLTGIETKDNLVKALKGWNDVETVFQEGEYSEWRVAGVPITHGDHPQTVAECIAQLTNTRLGPRRPAFLARRAATGILRFSILPEDNLPETIELNGKLLHIVKYNQGPPQAPASKIANLNLVQPQDTDETPKLPPQPISEPAVPITACFMCRKLGDVAAKCSRRSRGKEMKGQDRPVQKHCGIAHNKDVAVS